MEFKSDVDVQIATKMVRHPLLGEQMPASWNVKFSQEVNMTSDSGMFKNSAGNGRLPLYEGKMIWQFDHRRAAPRYWVSERDGRRMLMGAEKDDSRQLDYQRYRFGFRDVAASTNERSAIATIVPCGVFAGNTLPVHMATMSRAPSLAELAFLTAVFNSLSFDWFIRKKITNHLNFFYVYQSPIPRLTVKDEGFTPIVERTARLICTTAEFDDLAKQVGLKSHKDGATDAEERGQLRADLDGLVARLYGLTEEEFVHILDTFPLVEPAAKEAALVAFRQFAPKTPDQEVAALISAGESATLEFKSSARWDMKQNQHNKAMEDVIAKTVAAFLNSATGGTLLIGVDDDGQVVGLTHDYKTLGKKQNRDGFENWITTMLLQHFGQDAIGFLSTNFHEVNGQDVCRIVAKPATKPCYIEDGQHEHLYVRTGNATKRLTTKEAIEYSKHRWP